MMTQEDNELLTRVENEAPMGAMLRRHFWFPAALSAKLEAGGKPVPLRLCGRNYVLFRAGDGRVGCFDELCPHRGASLLLARNEDNALRCIFHGWKYSVTGECVDVPTQPDDVEAFCKTVPLNHHPTREAAGIVWVWLGGTGQPPKFPDFEFTHLAPEQCVAMKQITRYNWVQGVEGTMDSAHVGVLHQTSLRNIGQIGLSSRNKAPVYEFDDQPYGFRYAGIRKLEDGRLYTRVNSFVMPWFGFICPEQIPDGDRTAIFAVPVDDTVSIHWNVRYNPHKPLAPHSDFLVLSDHDNWPPAVDGDRENAWGQSRTLMKAGHFTGISHVVTEDFVVAQSQGPIVDRTKEYLNVGDLAVVRVRRLLLRAVREFQQGRVPALAQHDEIDYGRIRPVGAIIAPSEDWQALTV